VRTAKRLKSDVLNPLISDPDPEHDVNAALAVSRLPAQRIRRQLACIYRRVEVCAYRL
jgi:hypothetical protein